MLTVAAAAALLFIPGAAALAVARSSYRGLDRAGVALGLSIGLVPVLLLWSGLLGVAWSAAGVRIALLVAAAYVAWRALGDRRGKKVASAQTERTAHAAHAAHAPVAAAVAILLLALVLRSMDGLAIAVPAWVDGYHHTLIAQKILDVAGVPSDLRPWLAVDRFYYHFGFHAVAAGLVWLSGVQTSDAVLLIGQTLIALITLPTWVFARRLTGSRWAATFAGAVPATLYWFPAYFVTWGRYTQLAGLVILPIALIVLWDAIIDPRRGSASAWRIALASIAASGLVLIHYRVAVFYAIGAVIALAGACAFNRRPVETTLRWSGVALLGGALVAPWLSRHLLDGVRAMESVTQSWYRWDPEANDVPSWLFTIGDNRVWLAVGAIGLIAALLSGRAAALGTAIVLALAALAANPAAIGLPSSWMLPSFAVAISLFLPVAIGAGFVVSEVLRALGLEDGESGAAARPMSARLQAALAAAALVIALAGTWRMHVVFEDGRPSYRPMRNQERTEIFTSEDRAGMEWVRNNTAPDAGFLVSTGHWQLGSYRGLDGGYWLPLLTGRRASAPAALYNYGQVDDVLFVQDICERAARGDALTDSEIVALMEDGRFDHVYIGPAAARHGGFSADRMRAHPRLEERFVSDGVHIFRFTP